MIARLRGRVVEEEDDRLTLDVGGVGYEVLVPPYPLKSLRARTLPPEDLRARLVDHPEPITLSIHFHASERNPEPTLYGFNDTHERRFFALLCGVSRFGPSAAAKSMVIAVSEYAGLIMTRDVRGLSKLPGIGAGKAEQLIAGLRSKVALFAMLPAESLPDRPSLPIDHVAAAVQVALEDLGYKAAEAGALVARARQQQPNVDSPEGLLDVVWTITRGTS